MGFLEAIFGKGSAPGHDIIEEYTVPLADIAKGVKHELVYERLGLCPDCKGKAPKTCACEATGQKQETHNLGLNLTPKLVRAYPALLEEGAIRTQFPGEGEAGFKGGNPGDLYLDLKVAEFDAEAEESLEPKFVEELAAHHELSVATPADEEISAEAAAAMDADLAWRLHVCPTSISEGVLTVAVCDPSDEELLGELRRVLGDEIVFAVSTNDQIANALMKVYPDH